MNFLRSKRASAALVVLIAILWAKGKHIVNASQPEPAPEAATQVSVASAVQRDVVDWDDYSGRLEAEERVEIRSRVPGTIERVHFIDGQKVARGQLLFSMDRRPFEVERDRAAAALEVALAKARLSQREWARAQSLIGENAIAQREWDERQQARQEAEANVLVARADLRAAQLNLDYTAVRSPLAGRVSRPEIHAGNLIPAGAGAPVLTEVVSDDPLFIDFDVNERAFRRYLARGAGDKSILVAVGLDGDDGFPRQATLRAIDTHVDPSTGTARARAVLTKTDALLKPGMYARIRIGVPGDTPAVLVPDRAVGNDQHKNFVMAVGAGKRAVYREVDVGPLVDGLRVVRAGLKGGESVVMDGLQRVKAGSLLAPHELPASGPLHGPDGSGH